MRWALISLVLGLIITGYSLYGVFVAFSTHTYNGLCENRFTNITDGYTDYGEGVDYSVWLTDCCYDRERAEEVCNRYKDALRAEGETFDEGMCDNLNKENPATLFSCVDSTKLCNDEDCVQSCNNDGICKRELGEGYWCGDCQ